MVHSSRYEAIWTDCGESLVAMVDTADDAPVTCLFCVAGYDPFEALHERIVTALQVPAEFLGLR